MRWDLRSWLFHKFHWLKWALWRSRLPKLLQLTTVLDFSHCTFSLLSHEHPQAARQKRFYFSLPPFEPWPETLWVHHHPTTGMPTPEDKTHWILWVPIKFVGTLNRMEAAKMEELQKQSKGKMFIGWPSGFFWKHKIWNVCGFSRWLEKSSG